MARRKAQSVGEILIAYFTVCTESDAQALLLTARTITAARFPPQPAAKTSTRKPRAPKLTMPAPNPPAPVLGAAQQAAAAQSPIKRRRPPVADAAVAAGLGVTPLPPDTTAGDLPDQGDPADRD